MLPHFIALILSFQHSTGVLSSAQQRVKLHSETAVKTNYPAHSSPRDVIIKILTQNLQLFSGHPRAKDFYKNERTKLTIEIRSQIFEKVAVFGLGLL